MKQQPIDLLPDAIRARSQAGVVAGRYVVSVLIGVVLLGLTATHSRLMLDLARQRLRVAEEHADIVLSAEAKAAHLRQTLQETRQFIERYELIALPIDLSRVVATVTNVLPPSATLDRIDVYAGPRRNTRSARGKGDRENQGAVPRMLTGELSGFAATDQDVAQLVANLEHVGVFEKVSLDFSRTRSVRGHNAREFRISLRSGLDDRYEVIGFELPEHSVQEWGTAHVE